MNDQNFMLDLETLGQTPGSVIVAVGAVEFGDGKIIREFYERVDAESCVKAGLKMDVATVMWWLEQSDAARAEIVRPGLPLSEVLTKFGVWLDHDTQAAGQAKVWGNGAAFDNAVLKAAYEALRLPVPWRYSGDRCYRTVKACFTGIPQIFMGTKHNALDDARAQAIHLMELLKK